MLEVHRTFMKRPHREPIYWSEQCPKNHEESIFTGVLLGISIIYDLIIHSGVGRIVPSKGNAKTKKNMLSYISIMVATPVMENKFFVSQPSLSPETKWLLTLLICTHMRRRNPLPSYMIDTQSSSIISALSWKSSCQYPNFQGTI